MRKQVGLKLEESLVARVDAARGGLSRTAFFERALEAALRGSPGTDRIPGQVGFGAGLPHGSHVAARPASGRVQSSADAKAGVVPRWRGTDGSGS